MSNLEPHDYANIFPMMDDESYESLKKDIKDNGLLEPVILYEGKILDGRNRYKACKDLGINYNIDYYSGDSPLQYVISLNLKRRHLTPSQSAAIAIASDDFINQLKLEAKERQGERTDLTLGKKLPNVKHDDNKTNQLLAQTFNTNREYINQAKKLKETKPELYNKVKLGESTLSEIKKDLKIAEREEKLEKQKREIVNKVINEPEGLYDVIVIDPPWPYEEKYHPDSRRGACPYPLMPMDEIENIKLPSEDNSVLFLWTTHRFLKQSFELMKNWGYEYKFCGVWDKEKMGLGVNIRMQCEFYLVGFKDKPYWKLTDQRDIIREPRTTHSTKPDSFYDFVNSITVGRKLDYFARKKRDGWDVYGDEVS